MEVREIERVFERLGLATEEQRARVLSQGRDPIRIFGSVPRDHYRTWVSNGTHREVNEHSELERTPERGKGCR